MGSAAALLCRSIFRRNDYDDLNGRKGLLRLDKWRKFRSALKKAA
jgi:hypothetical protein